MRLLDALTDKPWLSPGLSDAALAQGDEAPGPWDKGIGLGLFLLVVTLVFTLITAAYLMRMGGHGGEMAHGGGDWRPMGQPPLLWINTFVLFASSLAFNAAHRAARADRGAASRAALLAGGVLGLLFLAGQLGLWRQLGGWAGNPATAFFTLICAFHGLHILGGLVAWGLAGRRLLGGAAPAAAAARALQLCARYWDFMLLVWLAMMGLFVST